MATVVCLIIKCENAPLLIEKRSFATVRHELAFRTFVSAHHQHECDSEQRIELASIESGPWTAVDNSLIAGEVLSAFNIKFIRVFCAKTTTTATETTTTSTSNESAFTILMDSARAKIPPAKKTKRFVSTEMFCSIKVLDI
jgi:hypothetical protein